MAQKRYSDEDALKILRGFEVHLHGGMGCKLMLFCAYPNAPYQPMCFLPSN
jgi:hypothetical protein